MTLIQIPADITVMPGCRFDGQRFHPTNTDGADLYPVEKIVRTPYGSVKRYAPDYPGVMIEPPATNLLLNPTSAFDQAAWVLSGGCIPTKNLIGPDGVSTNGWTISGLDSVGAGDIRQSAVGLTLGSRYSLSFRAKQITTSGVLRIINPGGISYGDWYVDLSKISTSWEKIDRNHASVTINNEFVGSAGGGCGPRISKYSGTGTLSVGLYHVQIEAGTFSTSDIQNSAASTVTRPADIITRPTPGYLLARKTDLWIHQRVKPTGAGQSGKFLLSFYSSTNAAFSLILNASDITLRKRLAGSNTDCAVAYTHAADTLFEVIAYQSSIVGMGLAVRAHDGDAWGDWSAWDVDVSTAAIVPGALYDIGTTGNATDGFSLQAAADFPWTQIGRIPSNLKTAEAIQAWLVAEVS